MPPPDCVWAQRKDRLWLTLKIVGAREQDVALRFFGEGRVSLRATCESAYQLEPLVYEMELDLFAVRAPRPRASATHCARPLPVQPGLLPRAGPLRAGRRPCCSAQKSRAGARSFRLVL